MALLLSRLRFLGPIFVAVLSVVVAIVGLKCGEYLKCCGANMDPSMGASFDRWGCAWNAVCDLARPHLACSSYASFVTPFTTAMPDLLHLLPVSLGVCSLAGMAVIWRDISSKVKGETRTVASLFSQYVAVKAVGWFGKRQRGKLESDTLSVKRVQEETLQIRLRKAANTGYGKKYDFCSITGE